MNTYEVTITIANLNVRETYTVEAADEFKARNPALNAYFNSGNVHLNFSGSVVEYDVKAV